MVDKCLDCGEKISPGWDFCQTCGSVFADQEGRTAKEQRVIEKKIRKRQKVKKKESPVRRRVVPMILLVLGLSGFLLIVLGIFLAAEFSLFNEGLTIAIIGAIPLSLVVAYPFRKIWCCRCVASL